MFKSSIRKARVHKGRRYVFGGLITELCRCASILEEPLDYFPHIEAAPYCVTNIKGLDVSLGPILTTQEKTHRDEIIMACLYRLEILRHKTGGRPFTEAELHHVEV